MSDTLARLTAWRPSMRDYLAHPAISSGFVSAVRERGLSTAKFELDMGVSMTTERHLVQGTLLHAWLEDHGVEDVHVCPPSVTARRGKAWEAELIKAGAKGCLSVALAADLDALRAAWVSLWAPVVDTGAKEQIRGLLQHWRPRVPEVSHAWEPPEVPGCWCRIREDIIARTPAGRWVAAQIKTTSKPLPQWWREWQFRRRGVKVGSAFYRAGLQSLFDGEPFSQLLIVATLTPPYPWGLYDLSPYAEDLDHEWSARIVPTLREITECLPLGYGPEEKGLDL